MDHEMKKITFAIPPDMELLLDEVKKELFHGSSQAHMLRTLIEVGLNVVKTEHSGEGLDSLS